MASPNEQYCQMMVNEAAFSNLLTDQPKAIILSIPIQGKIHWVEMIKRYRTGEKQEKEEISNKLIDYQGISLQNSAIIITLKLAKENISGSVKIKDKNYQIRKPKDESDSKKGNAPQISRKECYLLEAIK